MFGLWRIWPDLPSYMQISRTGITLQTPTTERECIYFIIQMRQAAGLVSSLTSVKNFWWEALTGCGFATKRHPAPLIIHNNLLCVSRKWTTNIVPYVWTDSALPTAVSTSKKRCLHKDKSYENGTNLMLVNVWLYTRVFVCLCMYETPGICTAQRIMTQANYKRKPGSHYNERAGEACIRQGQFRINLKRFVGSVLVVCRLVSRRSPMCDIWVLLMPHSINTDRLWHAMQRDNRERSLIWVRIY